MGSELTVFLTPIDPLNRFKMPFISPQPPDQPADPETEISSRHCLGGSRPPPPWHDPSERRGNPSQGPLSPVIFLKWGQHHRRDPNGQSGVRRPHRPPSVPQPGSSHPWGKREPEQFLVQLQFLELPQWWRIGLGGWRLWDAPTQPAVFTSSTPACKEVGCRWVLFL